MECCLLIGLAGKILSVFYDDIPSAFFTMRNHMPSGLPEVQSSVVSDSRSCVNPRKSLVYMEITTKLLFLDFKSWSFDSRAAPEAHDKCRCWLSSCLR